MVFKEKAKSISKNVTPKSWMARILSSPTELRFRPIQNNMFPSSAGLCARRNVLALTNTSENDNPLKLKLFGSAGDAIHEVLEEFILENGTNVEIEKRVQCNKLRLSGRIDIYVKRQEEDWFFDIKTVSTIPAKPRVSDISQMAVYSIITNIRKGGIIYVARKDMQLRVVEFDFSPSGEHRDVLNKVATTIAKSIVSLDKGYMPPRLDRRPYACRYCPFDKQCWEENKWQTNFDYNDDDIFKLRDDIISGDVKC